MGIKKTIAKESAKSILIILGLVVLAGAVSAASDLAYKVTIGSGTGFKIPQHPSPTVRIDEFTVPECRNVNNNKGGSELFVPTNTLGEWQAFRTYVSPFIADVNDCTPPPPGQCTIELFAGGVGGGSTNGNHSLNIGYAVSINNTSGSTDCGISTKIDDLPFSIVSISPLAPYTGPSYMVSDGESYAEGPSRYVTTNSGGPWPISQSANPASGASITCPAGTNPVAPDGWTASCNLSQGVCTTDAYGNTNCNILGCVDSVKITCQ